jgi:hypothetical protein
MEGAAPIGAGAASFVLRAKFSDLDFAPPRLALASRGFTRRCGRVCTLAREILQRF